MGAASMVCAYGGQAGGGFHNDAACRGATKIVRPPLMSGMRGLHGVRICLGCGRAGESSRCEDPAPTVGVGGDAFAWRVRSECRYYHRLPPHAMPPREPHVFHNDAAREGRALAGGRVCGHGSVCKPNPVGLRIAGGKAAECDLDAAR